MTQLKSMEQIYEEVKKHEWKEELTTHGTKRVLPLVFEAKCPYVPEKNIAIVFYPADPHTRRIYDRYDHVIVALKKPEKTVGPQIAFFPSFEKWFKYCSLGNTDDEYTIPESPFAPFVPFATMDCALAYMDENGMIVVLNEKAATEWGRNGIDLCREAYETGEVIYEENGKSHTASFAEMKELMESAITNEDFAYLIAIFENYESFMRHYYPQWEETTEGHRPTWLTEEEKKLDRFRYIFLPSRKNKTEEKEEKQ